MLKPEQFVVHEVWLVFKLNTNPIHIQEGGHNVFIVMDAGSTYVIRHALSPVSLSSPSMEDIGAIYEKGFKEAHGRRPTKLLIADNIPDDNNFQRCASYYGIPSLRISTGELEYFIERIRQVIPVEMLGDSRDAPAPETTPHAKSYRDSTKGVSAEKVRLLCAPGHEEERRRFTHSIEAKPDLVAEFDTIYNRLVVEDEIPEYEDRLLANAEKEIAESLDAMAAHLQGMSSKRLLGAYLTLTSHGTKDATGASEVTIELGWQDAMIGPVLWDRFNKGVTDPVMAYCYLSVYTDTAYYKYGASVRAHALPPLYKYHPERFKTFHESASEVGNLYRHEVISETGMLTLPTLNKVLAAVVGEVNKKMMAFPMRHRLDTPSPTHVIESVQNLITAYGRFVQAGKQIFEYPPVLVEMLANTKVDDVPLDSIKLPYASIYLYFGKQEALELEPGWYVDGAYIEARGEPGDIRFTITAVPDDRERSEQWYIEPEPYYTQDFIGQTRHMDLATAADYVLSDKLASLKQYVDSEGKVDRTEEAREVLDDYTEDLRVIDVSGERARERLAQTNQRHHVYLDALRLVVNALIYATSYPDDIKATWPERTPENLKQKAESGTFKEARRATSKLASLGYVPIHICGQRLADEMIKAGSVPDHDRARATHWRRGHWRNQAFGPARMLRKLIWLMPVLVGGHAAEETEGHLYLVEHPQQ